jgi:hypothetical protein
MEAWGFREWDNNLSDGFDSGSVSVNFGAWSDGRETMSVGADSPLSYTGDPMGSIGSVVLRAGVLVPGEAKFSSITVQFYHDDTLLETDLISSGPDANTIGTPSSPQQEQILTVTPTVASVNRVVVSATAQLRSPSDTAPGSCDMFCDIFVRS